jgi:autotransporter-associated beta strand protein
MAFLSWLGQSPDFDTGSNWSLGRPPEFGETAIFTDTVGEKNVFLSGVTLAANWEISAELAVYQFTLDALTDLYFIDKGLFSIGERAMMSVGSDSTISFLNESIAHRTDFNIDGTLSFADRASAETSKIDNYGVVGFTGDSTAGSADISNNSILNFSDSSTAGSATITTTSSAVTLFSGASTGGNAQFIAEGSGIVDFSNADGPNNDGKLSAGSIAGDGDYLLGANELTVGSNNLSTEVMGSIEGIGGSLVKVGAGTLTLSGTNGYTGDTLIKSGTLVLNGSAGTTHSASVTIDPGAILSGDITFDGVAANSFINKGTFSGQAHLGAGNDIYKGKGNGTSAKVLGEEGKDKLFGSKANDKLDGGANSDLLTGGRGKDSLFGGADSDTFDFNSIKDSLRGSKRDVINDFQRGPDDIDLKNIDAMTGVSGNQKFKFIGKQGFHDKKGELHYVDKGDKVIVQGDVNGDGHADFDILVLVGKLGSHDFVL